MTGYSPTPAGWGQHPYAFLVRPLRPADGVVAAYALRHAEARRDDPPLARAFACRVPPGRSVPERFDVYEGTGEVPLCTLQTLGENRWRVYAPDGTPLAHISRRPGALLPTPRRPRWTVRRDQDGATFVGHVGTFVGWVWRFLAWPVAIWATAYSGGDDVDTPVRPTRTEWRGPGPEAPLRRHGDRRRFVVVPSRLDPRVAYAQGVLAEWYVLPKRGRRRLARRAARRRAT